VRDGGATIIGIAVPAVIRFILNVLDAGHERCTMKKRAMIEKPVRANPSAGDIIDVDPRTKPRANKNTSGRI